MMTSIKLAGGEFFHHPGLHKIELKQMMTTQGRQVVNATADDVTKAKQDANEAYKAVFFWSPQTAADTCHYD